MESNVLTDRDMHQNNSLQTESGLYGLHDKHIIFVTIITEPYIKYMKDNNMLLELCMFFFGTIQCISHMNSAVLTFETRFATLDKLNKYICCI